MSPELFLRHQAGRVTARPMKGTAGRLRCPESDSEAARLLQQDVKNRAENLMIVDLLRNDLGRIAEVGTVQVPSLFAIEPYATVFQMTSTVQARLQPGITMPTLLRATFPCGSITGAPKHHTMDLIAGFETTPRGLYCGAIGWVDAPQAGAGYSSLGDFCLSVAIRTLVLGAPDTDSGARPLTLGVGAGIVQDSVAAEEFEECRLKARFLTGLDPGFGLFETMRVERVAPSGAAAVPWLDDHLTRLGRSAAALGFAWSAERARAVVAQSLAAIDAGDGGPWRLRLDLAHDGGVRGRLGPLGALASAEDGFVSLLMGGRVDPHPLSVHKTTQRARYDEGVRMAEAVGAFDTLFTTADGRLVEGGRSSLFVRLDGAWATPPLSDGALPGLARARVLHDGIDGLPVQERVLRLRDLDAAQALCVSNALRGVLPARLRPPGWKLNNGSEHNGTVAVMPAAAP